MKIVFVSNFLNHHQLPFCNSLISNNVTFYFVAIEAVPKERMQLGYKDMNQQYSFVVRAYESNDEKKKAQQMVDDADLVIVGAIPNEFTDSRIKAGKITFYYMERLFKYGFFHINKDHIIPMLWPNFIDFQKSGYLNVLFKQYRHCHNFYMLCASNYTAGDMGLLNCFRNRTYKWGYFPEVKTYNLNQLFLQKKSNEISLLWVGRLVDWKHPDDCIFLANKLKQKGYKFRLDIIGIGEMYNQLYCEIKENDLENSVHLLGAMPYEQVRSYMEKANIFLFTSDYKEGWGAVLNEAMNSGCAVVANTAAGCTCFLVQDRKNGLVYKNGHRNGLLRKTIQLMDSLDKCEELGKAAYDTIQNEWNANSAANRLLQLTACLENKETSPYKEGPCSIARRILNGTFVG